MTEPSLISRGPLGDVLLPQHSNPRGFGTPLRRFPPKRSPTRESKIPPISTWSEAGTDNGVQVAIVDPPNAGRFGGPWYIRLRIGPGMWAQYYGEIVERFRTWANEEPAVRAALIVGSQARAVAPADQWSDLDLVVFHTDPEQFLTSTAWFHRFGTVVLSTVERTAILNSRERRVLYSDGRDVDFAVFPSAAMAFMLQSPEALGVLGKGCEVLLDKDGNFGQLPALLEGRPPDLPRLPSEGDFQSCVADFWYHVLWAAKKLRRGEVWLAKMVCDGYLKQLLIPMIEWQAIARRGHKVDVWRDGRFLDRWAPEDVRAHLPATFAQYNQKDLARALDETARLFSRQARDVARAQRWTYPDSAEASVLALVSKTLNGL